MRFFFFLFFIFSVTVKAEITSIEEQLKQAIYRQEMGGIQILLTQYQQLENQDPILIAYAQAKLASIKQDYSEAISIYRDILSKNPTLNSIRMELAIVLFLDHQDSIAIEQFNRLKSAENLPHSAYQRIMQYLDILEQRNNWKIEGSFSYIKTNNVNNVSKEREIENTGFIKNENMLPKKANGIFYNINLSKEINLYQSHYFSFLNETNGNTYWDNHQYDEISNRTFMGYTYKKSDYRFKFQPFYDRRSQSNHSYHWSNGIQLSSSFWLSSHWQNHILLEYEKRYFYKEGGQSGNIKTLSNSLLWYPEPKQLFYLGTVFSRENTQERQYSSGIKSIRLGWLQEYIYGISTKMDIGFTDRKFKDQVVLGGILPLGKIRQDKIYTVNFQLWKRDWHWLGVTPKLSISWKKKRVAYPRFILIEIIMSLLFLKNYFNDLKIR